MFHLSFDSIGLFFLFFRHNQPETIKTVRIKEGLFSFALILWIATLIPATVIFATKSGYVTAPGIPDVVIASLVAASGKNLACKLLFSFDFLTKVQYKLFSNAVILFGNIDKSNTPIRAYVATGWCAFLSTVVNLILVSLEARHVLRTGVSDGVRGELVGQHTPKHAQSINEKSNLDHHEHQDEIRSEKMASVASTGTTGTHEANTGVNNGTSNIGNEGVRTGELHTAEKLV